MLMMASESVTPAAKVRLVRCPKCDNLLPELSDYSVYQCGACGAVLRARKNSPKSDTIADEERVSGGVSMKLDTIPEYVKPEKAENSSEKVLSDSNYTHETEVKGNSSVKKGEDLNDHDEGRPVIPDNYRISSKATGEKLSVNDHPGNKINGKEAEELKTQISSGKLEGSVRSSDRRNADKRESERIQTTRRNGYKAGKFANSKCAGEGPSVNCKSSSYNGYESVSNKNHDSDGFNRVEYLEQDRAELLRKLDELKNQLSRSCTMLEKPKSQDLVDARTDNQQPYGMSSNRSSMQYYAKPLYSNHYPEPYPFMNQHEMGSSYPTMHTSHHSIPSYVDPISSQMLGRDPRHVSRQHQPPCQPYYSEPYPEPYPPKPAFHHPSCSCFYCYDEHPKIPSTVKRFANVPNNSTFYNHRNPDSFGPHNYNARIPNIHQSSSHDPHDPRLPLRWPRDLNSNMGGGGIQSRLSRGVLAKNERHCHPVASGAPFITCCNCSELLQLPKKLLLKEKGKQKLQCESCSTVLECAIVNNKLIVSVPEEMEQNLTAVSNSSNETVKHSNGHLNHASMNFCSEDFDSTGYDFQSMEMHDFDSAKNQEMDSNHSLSSTLSENEDSPDGSIPRVTVTNSFDLPQKDVISPPPPGSPLQEYFDYSGNNQPLNRTGKGNQSSRSEHEKVISKTVTSRQSSIKDASVATEIDVSFNEYSNISKEEDPRPKINKGGESFFAGIIKKSFRSNHACENGKHNVTVNGCPIPDRLIKKAEKLAGPVHPGQYWYDVRAGFWGVSGGPCLGIIPPYIEEFKHPMSEDCAGGNTGVVVNGRELHKKDLELLASRGLPTDRDRSYIIDISGRVLDEDSGKELDSLGRLAPTVEKAKHGFGMKVPLTAPAR